MLKKYQERQTIAACRLQQRLARASKQPRRQQARRSLQGEPAAAARS